ncbi:TolC family protein [Desulfosediminicola flagellatus]|uniref:TolC family protein n=1 Tax=Desulfosediminicola flagellatus TaxID=2569541 RepID=UPI00142EC60A|nr:TolC family protein [Desulfosediminicola flagellatus]
MFHTGRAFDSLVLRGTFLVLACLQFNISWFSEAAALDWPEGETSTGLLNLYRKAAVDDPDGYVKQLEKVGSISLLEAVKTSLKKSLALDIQEETVNIAKGQYQSQGGAFDYTVSLSGGYGFNSAKLDSVSQAAIPFTALDSNQATTSLAVSKQLRTGPQFSLSSQLIQTDYTDQLMARYAGTADPKTTAIVKLEVKIPLLNGVGRFAASAETASRLNYEAGQYEYIQSIFQNTLNIVEEYWEYKAAYAVYDVNLSMESMIRKLLERETGRMDVASQAGPDSDQKIRLSTLNAKLADASRDTSLARQNITTARQAFALDLGVDVTDFGTLPVPADDFNLDEISLKMAETAYLNYLTELAMNNRPDLKSLNLKVKSSEVLVEKAKNNLQPRLDFVGSAGYLGLSEDSGLDGYLSSATDTEKGELWAVGISCSYPIGNQTAKGAFFAEDSSRKINVIQRNELLRQISSQLTVDLASLEHQISNLKQVNISVQKYWQAMIESATLQIENNSDLVNLLDLQEKLREAELDRSAASKDLAKAIASARFHSGTLVGQEGDKTIFNLERLTTLP